MLNQVFPNTLYIWQQVVEAACMYDIQSNKINNIHKILQLKKQKKLLPTAHVQSNGVQNKPKTNNKQNTTADLQTFCC